jgi:hypothetical protein
VAQDNGAKGEDAERRNRFLPRRRFSSYFGVRYCRWLADNGAQGKDGESAAKASWDSGWSNRTKAGKIVPGKQPNLTHIRFLPDDPKLYVEGQFRQVLHASGMRPITGPNDPFWNIRAFESAMTSHDGYVSYPLICSIFQFAMDKITDDAVASPSKP